MRHSQGYLAGGKLQLNRAGRVKSPIIHVCPEINSQASVPGLMRMPLRAGRGGLVSVACCQLVRGPDASLVTESSTPSSIIFNV